MLCYRSLRWIFGFCLVFGVTGSGCFFFNLRSAYQPQIKETRLSDQTVSGKKQDPDQLELLTGPDALPQGIYYLRQRRRRRRRFHTVNGRTFYRGHHKPPAEIYALPNYPAAGKSHVLLAEYQWSFPSRYRGSRTDIPEQVRKQASALGANTLFRVSQYSRKCYALYVSDALTKENLTSPADLLKAEAAKHPKFALAEPAQKHQIGQVQPIVINAQASHCYRLALALHPRAFWSDIALKGIVGRISSQDPHIRYRRVVAMEVYPTPNGFPIRAPYHGKYARMRVFSIPIGCAISESSVTVRLTSLRPSKSLGKGLLLARVLHKKMTQADLASDRQHRIHRYPRRTYRRTYVRRQYRRATPSHRRSSGGNFLDSSEPSENNDRLEEIRERRRLARARRRAAYLRARRRSYVRRARAYRRTSRSRYYSLTLRNRCRRRVKLFIGRKPRFSSGLNTSLGSNTTTHRSGLAPQTIWIVDRSGRGISSYTISPGRQTLLITRSCMGFALE